MSYVTWANWADGWNDTAANWASQTYTASADLDNTLGTTTAGNAEYPVSATVSQVFLTYTNTEDRVSQFSVVLNNHQSLAADSVLITNGAANLDGSYDKSLAEDLLIPASINLSGAYGKTIEEDLTIPVSANYSGTYDSESVGGFSIPLSVSIGSTLGQTNDTTLVLPVDASLDSSFTFNTSALHKAVGAATLANTLNITKSNTVKFLATASLTQLLLDEVNTEDLDLNDFSVTLPSNYGIIASSNVIFANNVSTLNTLSNIINNVNYPESADLTTNLSATPTQRLLWEDETEATTTWTEVAEGSDTWTKI